MSTCCCWPAPSSGAAICRARSWPAVRAFTLGLWPLAAWHLFSISYYGVPFPNTAYAKLATGIPRHELALQGLLYLFDACSRDPATPAAILLGLALPWLGKMSQLRPAAVALALSLAYVISVGGDFMSGRFLTAPFWLAVLLMARVPWQPPRLIWGPALLLAALSLGQPDWPAAAWRPAVTSRAPIPASGIVDERKY